MEPSQSGFCDCDSVVYVDFLGYLDVICGAWLTGDVTGSLTIGVIGGFASDYRVKCRWIIIINETLFKTIQ